ncbi:kelch repeat-containing protein [Colletotrichum truncatum]|uniref:Kelch repeat-containing protein n=1 Tax=Colletotrichum truncatum TaxID=5467 RepID=A0ACC3YPC8_COLTU|nr:kelch repeat-containing protein [Colletotrichum truncatum]KAF6784248.1 kelch repeat-containing protein [Colletotrichum truncatum]
MASKLLVNFTFLSSLLNFTLSKPFQPHSQWRNMSDIATFPRQEHTGLFLEPDTVAIFGGIIANSSAAPIPFTTVDIVQFYSIKSDTWRTVAPLPRAMNHVNVATVGGKIYAFGGLDDGGADQMVLRAVPDSYVYDVGTNFWKPLPPLPDEPRGMAAMGVHEGKIFLAGGFTALGMRGQGPHASVANVSIFDTVSSKWLPVPDKAKLIPGPRDHAGYAVVDGKMYVVGGFDHGAPNPRGTVFILDLSNLEKGWETSKALMPRPRGGFAFGVAGGKLYTFGGEGNPDVESGVYNETEAYDFASDTWERLKPMPLPRHSAPGIAVGGKIYIPGGGTTAGGAPTSHFDVFLP